VVGCGREGRNRLAAWAKVRTAGIEAVIDLDGGLASRAARDFYVPRSYKDLDRALGREKLDFVDVTVGVDGRPGLVRKCLAAGLHVLAGAPAASGLDVARELADLAAAKKLRLMICYPERWRSCFRQLKATLEAGGTGRAHYARIFERRPLARARPADPRRPGLDSLQHLLVLEGLLGYVDLVRWLFGEVKSVWGATLSLNPAVRGEDFALATMRTVGDDPVQVVLDVNWSSPLPGRANRPSGPEVRIEGSAGALELDPAAGVLRSRGHTGPAKEVRLPPVPDLHMEPWVELQGHFAECLENGREPDCSGAEAVRSLEAALAIYESDRSGGLVLVQKP
jgi:predicted dehydrogenase